MITFICCSIRPDMAAALNKNIGDTVGVPYEFIAFDNREHGYGICKVYNECARRAKYDCLCFLHEDVQFNTKKWGEGLINKLNEEDCGVIGFAGSIIKFDMPSGWGCGIEGASRINLMQHKKKRGIYREYLNPNNDDYSQVVTLDGLCLFARKSVWQESPFDEVGVTGFHCYDIDFAMSVALKHKNYVCQTIEVEHFSEGSFNDQWVLATREMYKKWHKKLPIYTQEWVEYAEHNRTIAIEYKAIRRIIRTQLDVIDPITVVLSFFTRNWYKSKYAWKLLAMLGFDVLKGTKRG